MRRIAPPYIDVIILELHGIVIELTNKHYTVEYLRLQRMKVTDRILYQ